MGEGAFYHTGKPSIINLHDAPSLTKLIGYIYTVLMDRVPLILVIGGQEKRHRLEKPSYREILSKL